MPAVSVIIPCFNQGEYLREAVESVRSQTFEDLEIIIVDDGSDDGKTPQICAALEGPGVKVINTPNQGLAAARNTGIAESKGQYILPLDADDKIGSNYIEEAAAILKEEPDVGIVYCKAQLFGAVNTQWPLPEYSLEEMLKNNIIFCSALYRRDDWERAGGYDPGMIYGWEDYDFWLSLIERGRQVRQLNGTHFFYRVDPHSMVRSTEKWQKIEMFKRIYHRHSSFIGKHISVWIETILAHNEPTIVSRLYVNCGKGISDSESIKQEINLDTKSVCFNVEQYENLKEIRFDPTDCPAIIEMISVQLLGDFGKRKVEIDELKSNGIKTVDRLFCFDTDDPQIFFPLNKDQLKSVSEILLVFNIRSIKEQALRDIIRTISEQDKTCKKSMDFLRLLGLKR